MNLLDLRVVAPLTLRPEILNDLQQEHIGIEWTKLRPWNTAYWAGISKDIPKLISSCEKCVSFRNAKFSVCQASVKTWNSWSTVG